MQRRYAGEPYRIVRGLAEEHPDAPHPLALLRARGERPRGRAAEQHDERASPHSITSSARVSRVVGTLRPMPLLGGRLILEDQAEQEMHVAAVGSAFRRLGSIGSPHLAQVPYVPSDIRFRAASI